MTANLPYLRDDAELMCEVRREPRVALVGGADGLALYRRFFGQLRAHLKPGGYVLIEADPWQHPALNEMIRSSGLTTVVDDYFIMLIADSL